MSDLLTMQDPPSSDLRELAERVGAQEAGVLATQVAEWAGSVTVLLRVYAGCIDGHEHMWNGRVEDALKDDDQGVETSRPCSVTVP
ncbi:hypothetical protein AB0C21_33080 [Spirillospora sp. NPDC049024]